MRDIDEYAAQIEPDSILPSQFFDRLRRKKLADGEHRLMVAVLEDAVNCFMKHMYSADTKARQLYVDAEEWITTTDQSWFFSFENVCQTLGLDADYMREGLLKWRDKQRALHAGRPAEVGVESVGAETGDEPSLRRASGA